MCEEVGWVNGTAIEYSLDASGAWRVWLGGNGYDSSRLNKHQRLAWVQPHYERCAFAALGQRKNGVEEQIREAILTELKRQSEDPERPLIFPRR